MLHRCHKGTYVNVATDVLREYGVSLQSVCSGVASELTVMFLMSLQVEASAPD